MIGRKYREAMEIEGNSGRNGAPVRCDWEGAEAGELYALPFTGLLFHGQTVHRGNFDPDHVETASFLRVKTGGCSEDCAYCAQVVHYDTGLKATRLMDRADVVAAAQHAKAAGATRFCMAAAWRSPKDRDLDQVCGTIADGDVRNARHAHAKASRTARRRGLDFYNHNVDFS
ncbi:biotin synthase-like enzyme [Bradyrhizobium sp. F1.13.1]